MPEVAQVDPVLVPEMKGNSGFAWKARKVFPAASLVGVHMNRSCSVRTLFADASGYIAPLAWWQKGSVIEQTLWTSAIGFGTLAIVRVRADRFAALRLAFAFALARLRLPEARTGLGLETTIDVVAMVEVEKEEFD